MRRLLAFAGAALAAAAITPALPAGAIINGGPDGGDHPNVGGLVSDTQYSDGTWIYCSGTLVSPTVFVTAAHCGEDGTPVTVTFSSAYQAGNDVVTGTFHADPGYTWAQNDPHDLAVVLLDAPITDITPAQLPAAGSLSDLAHRQRFTSVGYGAYQVTKGKGGHGLSYNDVRGVAVGSLNATNPAWLRISMNASKGDGGTCSGDSGGPNFLGATDIVAAVTITGDRWCRATNVVYRLDTPSARAFLGQFVSLP